MIPTWKDKIKYSAFVSFVLMSLVAAVILIISVPSLQIWHLWLHIFIAGCISYLVMFGIVLFSIRKATWEQIK